MKQVSFTTIAKDLNITHSAVSQWFNALTKPSYENMLELNKRYNIPFEAWRDIKKYIEEESINENNEDTNSDE